MFETQFNPHPRVYQELGSGDRTLYTARLDEDGNVLLTESGKEDLYASIQSHKDSCDIHVLLQRYADGDVDALTRVQGSFGDFTSMPSSYAELLNALIAGESYFNSLDVETRAKFDHSFEKFMISMDNMPEFMAKLGIQPQVTSVEPSTTPVSESEVKE